MPASEPTKIPFEPRSEADRRLILDELSELLKSAHFKNSKRYPALLLHIVNQRLKGNTDSLKERLLGIDVFGRPSDYDTNSDTIVRVTAGEVRKRLALAYHERSSSAKVQIFLPAGAYVPEFFVVQPRSISPEEASPAPTLPVEPLGVIAPSAPIQTPVSEGRPRTKKALLLWGLCLAGIATGAILLYKGLNTVANSSTSELWRPLTEASDSVLIIPGAIIQSPDTVNRMAPAQQKDLYPYTSFVTSVATANLINVLSGMNKQYEIRSAPDANLNDMRRHPVVVLGAYNNPWMPEIQKDLPIQFAFGMGRSGKIFDVKTPGHCWSRPTQVPLPYQEDYAVVARFRSSETGNWILLLGGIGSNGTEAASQFATIPRYTDQISRQVKNWSTSNIEIVLKLDVIDGKSGTPTIETIKTW